MKQLVGILKSDAQSQTIPAPQIHASKPRRPLGPKQQARKDAYEQARKAQRAAAQAVIVQAVEMVAAARAVPWLEIFASKRGQKKVAAARVFTMALCMAAGVPPFHIARAFNRNWASIYCANRRCVSLRLSCPEFATEWARMLESLESSKNTRPRNPPQG